MPPTNVPVLLIVFNRPDTTAVVFEAIRKAQPKRLYVAADAPRPGKPDDVPRSAAARAIVQQVDWDCEVFTLFQDANLGCSLGPRAAFSWFFAQEEAGIILEDDCVPEPSFFTFCAEMLERYRDDERIISINGCNLGYRLDNGDSYCYSRFMNMWGWATWRRSMQSVDYSLGGWKQEPKPLLRVYKNMRQRIFDTDINWYKYWKDKFDRTVSGETVTWWDWQWIYHQTEHHQLSIVPGVNLVKNIGFHGDGTHTHEAGNPAANLDSFPMPFPLKHPVRIQPDMVYEEQYVKWVWCYHKRLPALFHIKMYISKLLKR